MTTPAEALQDIKGYAASNRITLRFHANLRSGQRRASYRDIQCALMNATKCVVGQKPGRWEVDGKDTDGDDLKIVCVLENGVVVITLY